MKQSLVLLTVEDERLVHRAHYNLLLVFAVLKIIDDGESLKNKI